VNNATTLTLNRMYRENRKSLNWFVGCRHECVYCRSSFQAQMKRQLHNCKLCYDYVPHAHLERLKKAPPKTRDGEFIFFPSSGDPAFASKEEWKKAIEFCEKWSDRTFLIQSKNPEVFYDYKFPDNVILGITLETDRRLYYTPSLFDSYERISKAPTPIFRVNDLRSSGHKRRFVTVEPILQFGESLIHWIYRINPEFVYVGYDNHKCHLPEPKLADTKALIKQLEEFTEVRIKTLRKAWYEKQ